MHAMTINLQHRCPIPVRIHDRMAHCVTRCMHDSLCIIILQYQLLGGGLMVQPTTMPTPGGAGNIISSYGPTIWPEVV